MSCKSPSCLTRLPGPQEQGSDSNQVIKRVLELQLKHMRIILVSLHQHNRNTCFVKREARSAQAVTGNVAI